MPQPPDQEQNGLLKNLVPLNALSEEHLGQLVSRIDIEKAAKGDYLFREGDTDHQHVYLLSGQVSLLAGKKEVDVVQSGSNTARFAIAHQWPRKFSARALGPVSLVRIDSQVLSELLVRTQSQSYRVSELESDADGDWMSRVLRSSIFQQMPPSNIQGVLRRMEQVDARAGDVIVRQGDHGEYYYVVINGVCQVSRLIDGQSVEIAQLESGASFGEEALLADTPRSGTVTMTTDGMLMRLSKDDFVELIQRPLIKSLNQQQADEKVADGARWLDVRKAADFNRSHHTDALNIPLEELRGRSSQLSLDEDYVVCAASPAEAAIAAFLLRERGLEVSALTDIQSSFPSPAEEASAESTLAPALDQETDPLGLEGDSGLTPDSADGELPQVAEQVEDSSDALRLQLEQTQARFHNALYQRVAQLRRLKQLLKEEREKNAALREELVAANSARQALDGQLSAAQSTADRQRDLTRQSDGGEDVLRLKAKIEELQQDLDEAQDVLQEASAEESSYQWERLRWQSQQEAIEKSLQQQKDINEVLREENEETMRRMEAMNEQIRCLQAETQKKAG